MALLRNRPLALSCILLVCAIFVSLFLTTWLTIALFALFAVSLIIAVLLTLKKPLTHKRFTLILVILALMLGTLRVSADHILVKDPWKELTGTTVNTEMRIKEIRFVNSYQTELLADAIRIDGKRTSGSVVLRGSGIVTLCEGDHIRATCDVKALDHEASYEGADLTYLGEGARAVLLLREDVTLTKSGVTSPRAFLAQLRATLSYRISNAVGGAEGKLLSALLLGTRSNLPDEIVRDFSRAGASHLLALSGVHLSILIFLFDRFLLLFRCKRTPRMIVCLTVCFGYLVLTGFSFSMLRAIAMLAIVYLSFWIDRDIDSLTSLCVIASVLLLITPNAVYNLSFRLTFLATLGILIVSEMTEDLSHKLPKHTSKNAFITRPLMRHVYALRSSLIISSAALLAVLVIQWLSFGEVSLMTLLSNLLLVPLAPALLLCAIVTLILPITPIAYLAALPAKLALLLVRLLATPRAVISLRYGFVPYVLIPLLLLTILLLLLDLGKKRALICVPTVAAILAFAICLGITGASKKDTLAVLYTRTLEDEGIVLMQGSRAVVCDLSDGSNSSFYSYIDSVKSETITEIDTLILTHYHERHVQSVMRFCTQNKVRTLLLPDASGENAFVMERLRENVGVAGTEVSTYRYGTPLSVLENASICIYGAESGLQSDPIALSVTITHKDRSLCYHTASPAAFATHECHADTLLVGAHNAQTSALISPSSTHKEVYVCDEQLASLVLPPEGKSYQIGLGSHKFLLGKD